MELDLSREWRLFVASTEDGFIPPDNLEGMLAKPGSARNPVDFAVTELVSGLDRLGGLALAPGRGDEGDEVGIFILSPGNSESEALAGQARGRKGFAWRASPARVEIHADSGPGLISAVESFLEAAGLSWPAPGLLPHLARPGRIELSATSGRRHPEAALPCLIMGHGAYFEAVEEYLLWAARNGYAGIFFHTTTEALALGALPLPAYEARRKALLPLLALLGLEVELGGHGLAALLPRSLFKTEPGLFPMKDGRRRPEGNLCPSEPRSLEVVSANFSAFVAAHPEAGVFHVWPEDVPGGSWCECPACAALSAGAQSLAVARTLAAALGRERPGALLSFLAYHDTEDLVPPKDLPPNLELLWAPRRRSWAGSYGDPALALNAASAARFEAARPPFSPGPKPRVSVFEYWEDAVLFKTVVPPLGGTMAGDLLHYASRASRVGILLTGCRRPLAPRPNPWLFPRLLASAARSGSNRESQAAELDRLTALWAESLYGAAAPAMASYWAALEAAWRIDLDLEPGDGEISMPPADLGAVDSPPADWGDPWRASPERLGEKRARCDEIFEFLRRAEAALAEGRGLLGSTGVAEADPRTILEAEAREYELSSTILELDCARLSAYHEAARGQARACADIALLGLGMMYSARRSLRAIAPPRAGRDAAFLLELFYGLRLRSFTRGARGPLLRAYARFTAKVRLGWGALRLRGVWEKPRARREHAHDRIEKMSLPLLSRVAMPGEGH